MALSQRLTSALGQESQIPFSPSHTQGIHFIRNSLCPLETRNHPPIASQISAASVTHSLTPFFQVCGPAFSHFSEPCRDLHMDSPPFSPALPLPQGIRLYLRQNLMFMSQSSYLTGVVRRLVCSFVHIAPRPKTFEVSLCMFRYSVFLS